MSYGISVLNSAGSVQVDENYRNLALVEVRRGLKVANLTAPQPQGYGYLNIEGRQNCLVAVRSSNGFVTVGGQRRQTVSGGGLNWFLQILVDNTVNTIFDVYFFDTTALTPSSGYGFQVFNGAGQLNFDSAYHYLNVTSMIVYNSSGDAYSDRTYNFKSGRDYACVFSNYHWYNRPDGTSFGELGQTYFNGYSGGIHLKYIKQSFTYSSTATVLIPPTMMIVDVTGL